MGDARFYNLDSGGTAISAAHPLPVGAAGAYPVDANGAAAVSVKASSGNVANAAAAASLAGVAAKTTYITGFDITGSGATVGAVVSATVAGLLGGTATYTVTAATGATVANAALVVVFNPPLPSSAVNTAITVSCPALGAGNTNCTTNAYGFYL